MSSPFYFHSHNTRAFVDHFSANISQPHLLHLWLVNNLIDNKVSNSPELLPLVLDRQHTNNFIYSELAKVSSIAFQSELHAASPNALHRELIYNGITRWSQVDEPPLQAASQRLEALECHVKHKRITNFGWVVDELDIDNVDLRHFTITQYNQIQWQLISIVLTTNSMYIFVRSVCQIAFLHDDSFLIFEDDTKCGYFNEQHSIYKLVSVLDCVIYTNINIIGIRFQNMDKGSRQAEQHGDDNKLAKKIKNFIYHPSDQVGSGFSSHVYKGVNQLQQDPTKKSIAIKVIELSKIQNEVQNYLLNNQVNALKLLKHPNILNTVDILMTKNNVYIVTQFCEGGDLLKHIKNNGPFNEVKAMGLIKDVVEGYKCIQENNIIHRDLKTSNIFLSKGRAKIADFGFCEFVGEKKPQIAYNVGSPAYMSPESYKQNQYSHKSDIWAIGIILYELLIGETPDRTLTYTEMANNLTSGKIKNIQNDEIRKILTLCFKKNLKERIDSIGLAQLVSIQLNRLQSLSGGVDINQGYNTIEAPNALNNQRGSIGPHARHLSPAKANKDIKFFKTEVPNYPKVPPPSIVPVNPIPRTTQSSIPQPIGSRKSLTRERIPQSKPNQFKPHTQYLLFLYRVLKFIGEIKSDKLNWLLLPIFRHRSHLESLAQSYFQSLQSAPSNLAEQEEFYKQLQYLKNRFDETYIQMTKQMPIRQSPYKQKLDSLANVPFANSEALAFYRKVIKDVCADCVSSLQTKPIVGQTAGRDRLATIFDYLIIWHELLCLHLEGMSLADIVAISKLEAVVKEQPKKITPGHIELLKLKYNAFINTGSPFNEPPSSKSITTISKDSHSKQRITSPNNPLPGQLINAPPVPHQQLRGSIYPSMQVGQPVMGQPPVAGGQVGYLPFASNAVNQIPVHQSIVMHR